MSHTWKSIPGYEGVYEVSTLGGIRALERFDPPSEMFPNGRLYKARSITPTINNGYFKVKLYHKGRGLFKTIGVHRLVLLAFVGNPPPKYQACHNDGNPTNNALSNLRWDTNSENQRDRIRHGATMKGEKNPSAKLTEADVRAIRADTRKLEAIASDYGVIPSTVSHIRLRRNWAHI